jgi:hypothetical protein
MSTPVFATFVTLLTGWIFAPRRTVTGMIIAAGVAGQRHHAVFHRVFSAARWSLDHLGLLVFVLLKVLLGELVQLTLDDTGAHKRGRKVYGAAVIVRLPCCPGRVFSLPILFRLYVNHDAAARAKCAYRTRPELALSGGEVETLAIGQAYPWDIAIDATHVYWTNFGTGPMNGSVMKVAK